MSPTISSMFQFWLHGTISSRQNLGRYRPTKLNACKKKQSTPMLCIIRSDKCTLMYIHLVFLDAFPYLLHVTTHCQDTDHIPKHTIFMNKLYVKGHYRSLNEEEKEEYWYWARQSMEARKVRQIVISLAGTRKEDHPQMMDAWILVKTWWAIL